MMVVVISDDYFMSKWPMMEIRAFVQAMEDMSSNTREKYILPLFYDLSVEEFRDKERRRKWVEEWMVAKGGDKRRRIDVIAWEKAVDVLGNYNGIEYIKSSGITNYLDEIVSHICDKIIADVKWDDSHVQGKSNICKVFLEKAKSVDCMEKYNCKTVGIFGVGGIGKTTICKALCNALSNEYKGRVCHIELETKSRVTSQMRSQATSSIVVESLRKLVILLKDKNLEFVQTLDERKCKNILRNSDKSHKAFFALDNVWDVSVMEAKTILEASQFHEESLVIVTARSRATLEMLGIRGDACLEMPELGEEDAVKLFLYHAAGRKQFGSEEEKRDILECVKRCYFEKGGGNGGHYHPLALHSLGAQVSCFGEKPAEWVRIVPRSFEFVGGGNPVLEILRSSFDMLNINEQSLFMDLVVYRPFSAREVRGCDFENFGPRLDKYDFLEEVELKQGSYWAVMVKWLCLVHDVSEDKIKSQLDSLRRKGLLMDVDWTSGRMSVHDLYMEFAELESKGILDESLEFEKRRFIIASMSDLKKRPSGGCWEKLERVGILGGMDQIVSLERIKWGYFSNVVVLELKGDREYLHVHGSLNLKGLECLRSLTVIKVYGLDRIEGLDGLDDLIFFKWKWQYDRQCKDDDKELELCEPSIEVQLPTSLEVLDLTNVWLERDVLLRCNKLHKMTLLRGGSVDLDLIHCSSLEILSLRMVEKFCILSLPRNSRGACGLKSLLVRECWDLVEILGLDDLIGLERLELMHRRLPYYRNGELELPDLGNLTNLKELRLWGCRVQAAGLCNLRHLRKLFYCSDKSNKAPSLRGCDQLEVLRLELKSHSGGDEEQTNLEGLEDLPALRTLMLFGCKVSAGWPELSRSKKLETIILDGGDHIMLQEDDMHMLASLPLLQRVEVEHSNLKLDVRRRKWINATFSQEWDFHIHMQSVLDDCRKLWDARRSEMYGSHLWSKMYDMHMRTSLPLLQAIEIRRRNLKLDLCRRKWIGATISQEWDFHIPLRSMHDDSRKLAKVRHFEMFGFQPWS